ncbi:hypothetical protein [Cupriavidus campinensis]|uniref:hypothetical protein n=1 Tax=Cupriavidus campinensis TaxID=151783 RepID=UPI0011EBB194|nr:hypothetical protein [Cupriavidus campinensis]
MKNLIVPFAAVAVLAGCATAAPAAPAVGALVSLTGEIHIKGNDPFPVVLLQADNQVTWEVSGISMADARQLSGQWVTARGTVQRSPGAGTWMPALRVEGLPTVTGP